MKIGLSSVIFLFIIYNSFGQVGLSSPLFLGKDAKLVAPNWGIIFETGPFIPISMKNKDSTIKAIIVFQPTLKIEWLNFKNNLVVERNHGVTSFVSDTNISHEYKNGFFRTSSMMQTTSFFMPIEVWFQPKKLKGVVFAPGFYIEYVLGGRFKNKYSQEKEITKYKSNPDFFGFNRLQYGPCGHISYKFLTIYGIYSLQPVFKRNQGIDISRFSIGVWLNFFYKKYSIRPY